MLKNAICTTCGTPVEVDVGGDGEFLNWIDKMRTEHAECGSCAEKSEAKRADAENKRLKEEEERDRARLKNGISSVVGRKYQGCTLETFSPKSPSQSAALAAAKNFSADPVGFLYLHGKPGVGKTHLAIGIFKDHAKTLIEKNELEYMGPLRKYDSFKEADYWTIPDLLLHLRSQIGNDVGEEQAIEFLLKSKLLILDDLGAEKMTDWVRQAFYVVISRRERDEMPTVITSNLSLGEIEARVGDERITSRIGGAARIVKIEGKDERLESRKGRK